MDQTGVPLNWQDHWEQGKSEKLSARRRLGDVTSTCMWFLGAADPGTEKGLQENTEDAEANCGLHLITMY